MKNKLLFAITSPVRLGTLLDKANGILGELLARLNKLGDLIHDSLKSGRKEYIVNISEC